MLKILGVGLSRTGTTSLTHALRVLGFKAVHWAPHRLIDILDGRTTDPDWRRYDDVDAATDIPAALFYDELSDAYPGLRCILTTRDIDAWWSSLKAHFEADNVLDVDDTPVRHLVRDAAYGSPVAVEYLYKKRFREHNERVVRRIPPARLLVMNICAGDGWEPLCRFLGQPIPDAPFPHTNRGQAP